VLPLLAALFGLPVPARSQSFGPEVRIGDFGTVPALVFAPDGSGHMVYRRQTAVYYRFYDGSAWGPEVSVNSASSSCEAEFLDRNQPKLTRDPNGVAWIVWGGQVRDADKNLYLRAYNPDGTAKTGIKSYRYRADLLNPEEVAVSYDPTNDRLHLYGIYVGDPTKAEDGHYDLTVHPQTLQLLGVEQLGPAQKNIYGFTGPARAFAFARLHQVRFYRSKDNGAYDRFGLRLTELQYSVGALRFFTRDDRIVHFGVVSTQPSPPYLRDVSYLMFDADTGTHLGQVLVDPEFDSPYGLVHPASTPSGNLFLTWDEKRSSGKSVPAYAYRRAGSAPGAPFSAAAQFPDYPAEADAHAPAAWALGETIYIVWGDKLRNGLYARSFTFGDLPPVPTLSVFALLALSGALGAAAGLRLRFRRGRVPVLLAALALGVMLGGCGDSGEDPNDPNTVPTPVPDRASVGYRLLRGVDRLDELQAGTARLYSSHHRNDASNIDYNQYLRRDPDGSYVMAEHNGPGVITRLWMTARIGTSLQNSQPGFSSGALLRVYTDGSATPLFSINPNRFFAGELFPFVAPLVGQHSTAKGFYSYVPISFAASVKVTLTDPFPPGAPYPTERVFYQINVLDLTGQAPVQASPVRQSDGTLALSPEDQAAHQQALTQWRDPVAFANLMTQAREKITFAGPVSGTAVLASIPEPGRIRGLRLFTSSLAPAELQRVRLRIFWDGDSTPSVDLPLAAAWGSYYGRGPFASLVQGALSDGTLYLRYPMSFRQSARLELQNRGSGSLPITGEVYYDPGTVPGTARYFHAEYVERTVRSGERLVLAQVQGSGHLVGLHLVLDVKTDPQALEGDEFINADGAALYKGTGTEDFFNAHWFFEGGLRSVPLNGTTSVGPRFSPDVDTFRFLVPDLVPFRASLNFQLENANAPGNSDDYRSVVFYYKAR
jgi:hypothetical protein